MSTNDYRELQQLLRGDDHGFDDFRQRVLQGADAVVYDQMTAVPGGDEFMQPYPGSVAAEARNANPRFADFESKLMPEPVRNPEADVLDAIDELVNESLAAHHQDDYNDPYAERCDLCGEGWHGTVGPGGYDDMGARGCPGAYATDEARAAWNERHSSHGGAGTGAIIGTNANASWVVPDDPLSSSWLQERQRAQAEAVARVIDWQIVVGGGGGGSGFAIQGNAPGGGGGGSSWPGIRYWNEDMVEIPAAPEPQFPRQPMPGGFAIDEVFAMRDAVWDNRPIPDQLSPPGGVDITYVSAIDAIRIEGPGIGVHEVPMGALGRNSSIVIRDRSGLVRWSGTAHRIRGTT